MTIAANSLRREIQIANLQPARPEQRQIQANERELDRDRRNEREGAEMMEEGNSVDIRRSKRLSCALTR